MTPNEIAGLVAVLIVLLVVIAQWALFFNVTRNWTPHEAWLLLKAQNEIQQERIDRLTEAVARQQSVSLRMPLPETQPRQPTEKSRGWFEQLYNPFSEKSKQ